MLLVMSVRGGFLILIIYLFRKISWSWFPKRLFVYLWIIASLRLVVPVGFTLPIARYLPDVRFLQIVSERNFFIENRGISSPDVPEPFTKESNLSLERSLDLASNPSDSTQKALLFHNVAPISIIILYIIGLIVVLVLLYLPDIRAHHLFSEALPLTEDQKKQVFEYITKANNLDLTPDWMGFKSDGSTTIPFQLSDRISTPVTEGIFRQKIVLSKTLTEQEPRQLLYILLHECIHYRRRDNLLRFVVSLTAIVQWFNPFSWLMFYCLKQDIEFSCDEKVLSVAGTSHQRSYAKALLFASYPQNKSIPYSTFGRSGKLMKKRLNNILNYRKNTAGSIVFCTVILFASVFSFATTSDKVVINQKMSNTIVQIETNQDESDDEQATTGLMPVNAPAILPKGLSLKVYNNADGTERYRVQYHNDNNNRCISATLTDWNGISETKYFYDRNGFLSKAVRSDGTQSTYICNEYGFILIRIDEELKECYSYNDYGNLTTDNIVGFSGELLYSESYSYEYKDGLVSKAIRYDSSASNAVIDQTQYKYDKERRVLEEQICNADGDVIGTVAYHYNNQ